jgi:muconolactone delta-isomerase
MMFITAEVFDLETNENLRMRLDSMQMPRVEYKEINIEDYSTLCSKNNGNDISAAHFT